MPLIPVRFPFLAFVATLFLLASSATAQEVHRGERLDPATYGQPVIESLEAAIERERVRALSPTYEPKLRNGRQGVWIVPTKGATGLTHSGEHYITNSWGDTSMGIAFTDVVDVQGAYLSGQSGRGVWTLGVRAVGFRRGRPVASTDWFRQIDETPTWFEMDLCGIDRVVIESLPVVNGGGWYAMDDFTFTSTTTRERTVVTFDDLDAKTDLTGSRYMGLIWETGTGDFTKGSAIHSPQVPPDFVPQIPAGPQPEGGGGEGGTLPDLEFSFQGIIRGQDGSFSFPPDTHGAVGVDYFVETVNRNFAVYNKADGSLVTSMGLGSFLPGSSGDPRVLFDQHSMRWVVMVTDFSSRIYLAVSRTTDPTGLWFKTNFNVSQGSDAGRWPDYPTLGVDDKGIYVSAYMVGGGARMSIFAIDKEPLVASSPSLGTVTAFRTLPWEGAIQPVHTYGQPGGEFFVSVRSSSSIRVRELEGPMTSPTLIERGWASVPFFLSPPNASSLGSLTALGTVGTRLMMSMYRDGHIWTAHTIASNGRAACRWYQIDAESVTLLQSGTVRDDVRHYFFPSIMVNQFGNVAMGFSGSSSGEYASAYYTGRRLNDPPGEMAPPVLLRAGSAPQNNIDNFGRNRWGDYSYTTLDPVDQQRIWTVQQYAHDTDIWGTWVGVLNAGDCNNDGMRDECEISCGQPGGLCDIPGCGQARDCNANNVPDECDISSVSSLDLNDDGTPDECPNPGDLDDDGDVDIADFAGFHACAMGDTPAPSPEDCASIDFDGDDVVSVLDYGTLQAAFTGECGVRITLDPVDAIACPLASATMTVAGEGDALTYQWIRNGTVIPGATDSLLIVSSATNATAGVYAAYAVSSCAVAKSADATLALQPPPVITAAPEYATACVGGTATFTVAAIGREPLSYQWRHNNQNIPGATDATFVLQNADEDDAGAYGCRVTDACGQPVLSPVANLGISEPLAFELQPMSATHCTGENLLLVGSAAGFPNYQWFKDGQAIPGETQTFLWRSDLTAGDAGTYTLGAFTECESDVSEPAVVVVQTCGP